jgi:hypothetical protein
MKAKNRRKPLTRTRLEKEVVRLVQAALKKAWKAEIGKIKAAHSKQAAKPKRKRQQAAPKRGPAVAKANGVSQVPTNESPSLPLE